jgi:threonine dehydrogenase-like Zn-dependent dehydrogenase
VLQADHGAYVLPVSAQLGYAETALTEPWACVEGAYRQRRRLTPLPGGVMWIVGRLGDTISYQFSEGLAAPATIVLTDVPDSLRALIQSATEAQIIERDGLKPGEYPALNESLTGGHGFDDIVLLDPRSAAAVSAAAQLIARRGTFNMVGRAPLDGLATIDVGRIHYDYTAYLGNPGPDIAASYGEAHNRSDLRADGVTVFVGAGGPMGQMHIQRAIEVPNGPKTLIATDVNAERLAVVAQQFAPLVQQHGKRLITFNPQSASESLRDMVLRESGGRGADDVIACVPSAALMADAATLLARDGMLVLFAGVPNGTLAPLNLSDVYLHNAQFTGTSGSALADQATVIRKTIEHELSPNRSVAAIGGIEAARDGIVAMMEGRFPGKIVIFPQISGLPLTSIADFKAAYPDLAAKLAPGDIWTPAAEQALIEHFWR